MSILSRNDQDRVKAPRSTVYNSDWVYGPAGGITASELGDIKDGDHDRETGQKRCVFCRVAKPLNTGNGTTCDAYCERNEYGSIPVGKPYAWDKDQRGREWLTLG